MGQASHNRKHSNEMDATEWSEYAKQLRAVLDMGRDRYARVLGLRSPRSILRWEKGDPNKKTGERVRQRPSPQLQERLKSIRAQLEPGGESLLGQKLTMIAKSLMEDDQDRILLGEALRLIQEALRKRESTSPVAFNVDRDAEKDPPWLRLLLDLLKEEEWEVAARVAPHFSELAEAADKPDIRCLYLLRWGVAAGRSGDPKTQLTVCSLGAEIAREEDTVPPKRLRALRLEMGCAYTRMGKYLEARHEFEAARDLDRANSSLALYNLLAVSSLAEEAEACKKYARLLVSSFPDVNDPTSDLGRAALTDADLQWWRSQSGWSTYFDRLVVASV